MYNDGFVVHAMRVEATVEGATEDAEAAVEGAAVEGALLELVVYACSEQHKHHHTRQRRLPTPALFLSHWRPGRQWGVYLGVVGVRQCYRLRRRQ